MLSVPDAIVSCQWLNEHLQDEGLVILNATIPKATAKNSSLKKEEAWIPHAQFFDIKGSFSDSDADFPNTMISSEAFQKEAQKLGINQDSCVVVYDEHGIYSAPRAWWMFKAMGFENVAVLDGGLPEWKSLGYKITTLSSKNSSPGNFTSNPKETRFVRYQYVLDSIQSKQHQILDARSSGRFFGTSPEPREGVRSGHIPTSKSLPYSSLLDGYKFKNTIDLRSLYQSVNTDNVSMIFSCGTGITACVLALGAEIAGYKDSRVYDGSWTEWGSLVDLPIEV